MSLGRSALAWAFLVNLWRRRHARAAQQDDALNGLRRSYVFGSLTRQQFDEVLEKQRKATCSGIPDVRGGEGVRERLDQTTTVYTEIKASLQKAVHLFDNHGK
jgi:hypothetical protein